MSHPLQQRIRAVARKARAATILYGVAWLIVTFVVVGLLLGGIDYLFHLRELGVRLISSLTLLSMLGGSFYFFLLPAWRRRYSDVAIAKRIERRYPQLRDRLASTIEFLEQSEADPMAGSAAMRRAVVAETAAACEGLDFTASIDARWTRRLALLAMNGCRLLLIVCLLSPNSSWLVAQRLLAPWSSTSWNELRFSKVPGQLARGKDLYVELIDRNRRMPEVVFFQYRFDGESKIRKRKMSRQGDRKNFHLNNITRSLEYRAVGGDDETLWQRLEIIDPPQITDIQIKLHPPAYTALPIGISSRDIRALQETIVSVVARVDKPLTAVRLKTDDKSVGEINALVSDGGYGFTIPVDSTTPWTVNHTGQYWFELVDRNGHVGGEGNKWKIHAIPDRPPTVTMKNPRENLSATRLAVLSLQVLVEDDLAVKTVELRYLHPDQSERGEQAVVLYRGPEISQDDKSVATLRDEGGRPSGDSQTIDYSWDLSKLGGLDPSNVISFYIAALDYKLQETKIESLLLRIISPDELEDRIARQQASILEQLTQILHTQEAARDQTLTLEDRIEKSGRLGGENIDQLRKDIVQLQSDELNQREIQRRLIGPTDGVAAQIAALVAELKQNQIDNPDLFRRMNRLQSEIHHLAIEPMPTIQRELISALQAAREDLRRREEFPDKLPVEDPTIIASLHEADRGQGEMVAALEKMIDEYSQWNSYRRFAQEISRLRRDQQQLQEQTAQLRSKTLGQDVKDLSPADRADLLRLAQRQHALSRRFDRLQSRMNQKQAELQQSDPLIAETLADTTHAARRLGVDSQMRQSSSDIEKNRLGEATRRQEEVARNLDELLDILSNRREHELDRTVKKLRQAADQLEQLRKQEEELRKQIESAAKKDDQRQQLQRLMKRQQQAAEETKRLARQLKRLRAQRTSDSLEAAGERLEQSASAAEQGNAKDAERDASEGEKLLQQAEQELQQEIQRAEQDLFQEQLTRLPQLIEGLVLRQKKVIETTAELDALRDGSGKLPRAQLSSIARLANEQRELAGEAGQLATKIALAEVFELGLRGAAREMLRASGLLDRQRTGKEVQQAEGIALARLRQLLAALKQGKPQETGGNTSGGQGGEGNLPQNNAIRALAELKLLKLMQEEVNRRTTELERLLDKTGELTEPQQHEIDGLAKEQQRLADLILNLTKPPPKNREDEPVDLDQPEKPGSLNDLDRDLLDSLLPSGEKPSSKKKSSSQSEEK